ncbi:MAG: MraY family glycosyltransferase [Gemmataceae bacterium]
MLDLFAVSVSSFLLCLLITPLARILARRYHLVDRPDGRRKLHSEAVAVAGGIPLLLSASLPLLLYCTYQNRLEAGLGETMIGLLLASVLICVVGMADDLGRLRGRHKVLGQVVAVCLVMSFGVQVHTVHLFEYKLELGLLSIPFTAFLLLGAINSLNLLDGMDGLLCCIGAIICVAMAATALVGQNLIAACIALSLAGALLGFLRYNFPPATIFLGDSGSMLIGLVVGVLAIQSSLKGPAAIALVAPTAVLIIPIFDTLAAILRRKLTGRSIYCTDRGHLHHCLLRHGFSARGALLLISGFCLVTMAGTFASLAMKNELVALLSAVSVIAILIATRLFGHAELELVLKRLRSFAVQFVRGPRTEKPHETAVRLQGTVDWRELWMAIVIRGTELNLSRIRLDVNAPAINEGYHARWDRGHRDSEDIQLWRADIPLSVQGRMIGQVEVTGYRDEEPVWTKMTALANLLQEFEEQASRLTDGAWKALPREGMAARPIEPAEEFGLEEDKMLEEENVGAGPRVSMIESRGLAG